MTRTKKSVALLALVGAIFAGVALFAWHPNGAATAAEGPSDVKVVRGPLTLTVGGVGHIVPAGGSTQTITTSSGSTPTETSGFGVYPQIAGTVTQVLVAPGQQVSAGQTLMVLDDGGASASAVAQAQNDAATARLELRLRERSDPQKGPLPTRAEFAAARVAVRSARQRLRRLLAPTHPLQADVGAARLEVERAAADLETLLGGPPATRAGSTRLAQRAVEVARGRLEQLLAPPKASEVSAAKAELSKAQADLETLKRPSISPSPESLAAANKEIVVARQNLAVAQKSADKDQIRDAQASLDAALADLALLLKPGPEALPAQIAAAQAAVDAAQQKLNRLYEPPNPADVSSARLEVERAEAELATRLAGPTPAALAAARQAVKASKLKLAQLSARPLQADVNTARLDVRRAEADLAVLEARRGPSSPGDIAIARVKVEGAEDRLASARQAYRPLAVRAPQTGTVTTLLTTVGAHVEPTAPVAVMADLEGLEATVDLSEFDVAQVEPGQKATVSVDALGGETFPGVVMQTALTGNSSGGVVTFPVRVSISEAEGLRPGMNVSIRIVVEKRSNAVQVPLEAVSIDDEDHATVMVVNDAGESSPRKVVLGLETAKNVEIIKGLAVGEFVALPEVTAPEEEA